MKQLAALREWANTSQGLLLTFKAELNGGSDLGIKAVSIEPQKQGIREELKKGIWCG